MTMHYMIRIIFLFSFSMASFAECTWASQNDDDDNDLSEIISAHNLRALPVTRVERLITAEQHVGYLHDRIQQAQQSILISTHGISHTAMVNGDIYTDLGNARNRGVAIHVYNTYDNPLPLLTQKFFEAHGIQYVTSNTHAKVLAVDNKHLAVGSCNWLNGYGWENATFCLFGDVSQTVGVAVQELKYHENKKLYDLVAAVLEEDALPHRMNPVALDHANSLNYLHSIQDHKAFIRDAFDSAQERIIVCSPFIHRLSGYKADFSQVAIANAIKRGVHVYFACRQGDYGVRSMKTHLYDLRSPFLHFLVLPNFHLKTFIVDNKVIADGSFNWFSSNRYVGSSHQRYEVSLVLKGPRAAEFIAKFEQDSPVGQAIMGMQHGPQLQLSQKSVLRQKRLFQQDVPSSQDEDQTDSTPVSSQNIKVRKTEVGLSRESALSVLAPETPKLDKAPPL